MVVRPSRWLGHSCQPHPCICVIFSRKYSAETPDPAQVKDRHWRGARPPCPGSIPPNGAPHGLVPRRTSAAAESIGRTKIGNHLIERAQQSGRRPGPAAGTAPRSGREPSGARSRSAVTAPCQPPVFVPTQAPPSLSFPGSPRRRRCPRWDAGGTLVSSASGLSRLAPSRRRPGRAAGPGRPLWAAHFPSGRTEPAGRPPAGAGAAAGQSAPRGRAGPGRGGVRARGGSPLPEGRPPAALPGPHPARGRWRRRRFPGRAEV